MINDAKWYANWIRLLDASTPDEKMRNLEAADMLEQLEAAQPKWISVDDPPKKSGRYLVLLDNGKCCDAVYDTCINSDCKFGEWYKLHDSQSLGLFDRAWMSYMEVTHWMPMIPLQK